LDISQAIDDALLDIESGNAEKAEPILRSALSSLPKDSDATSACLEKLAGACSKRGNYDDAIRLNIRLLHDLKVRYGETDERALNVMRRLLQLYRNVGRFGEADFLRSRLAALESKLVYDEADPEAEVGAPETEIERPRWLRRALTNATDSYTRPQVKDASIQTLIDIVVPEAESVSYAVSTELIEATRASSSGQFNPKTKAKIEKAAKLAKIKVEKQRISVGKRLKGAKPNGDASPPVMPLPNEERGRTSKAAGKDKKKTEPEEQGQPSDQNDQKKESTSSSKIEIPSLEPSDKRQLFFYFIGDLLNKLRIRRNSIGSPNGASGGFSIKKMIFGEPAPPVRPKTGREAMEVPHEASFLDFFQLPKELEDRKKIIRRNIVIGVVFIAVLWLMPRTPTPNEVFARTPVSYRTADGQILLRFEDLTKCKMDSFGTVHEWPCAMFLADWRDFVVIDGAQLVQKQIWLTRTAQGLRSPSGVMFYGLGSPELQLTDLMKNLAERAKVFYARHGVYPENTSKNIAYLNPYSGLKELPTFENLFFYDATARDNLVTQTNEGKKWSDELKPHPGQLSACSATIKGADGEHKLFFIRAYGRDAKLLTGSATGTAYYLALQDGADLPSIPHQPDEIVNRSQKAITYWRLEKGTNRFCMFLIIYGAALVFGIVSAIFIALSISPRNSKKRKRVYWVVAGIFGLIALVFFSIHLIP